MRGIFPVCCASAWKRAYCSKEHSCAAAQGEVNSLRHQFFFCSLTFVILHAFGFLLT